MILSHVGSNEINIKNYTIVRRWQNLSSGYISKKSCNRNDIIRNKYRFRKKQIFYQIILI